MNTPSPNSMKRDPGRGSAYLSFLKKRCRDFFFFCLLLGVFAIGAPGVPGGTVLASLGLIIAILGFDEAGTALLLTIFALQDSFGTACNVTGDGALTLITDTFDQRQTEKASTAL